MEKPVRKRGRPPITKDYANPLESPMAHSSLRMQRQGAQVFQRPTMKVGSVTPSPKNRSFSNSGIGNGGGNANMGNNGNSTIVESGSQPGSSTKKTRYRGVILSTPTKWPAGGRNDTTTGSTGTPTPSSSDSVFCSASKLALKSSPPLSTSPLKDENDENVNSHMKNRFPNAKGAGPNFPSSSASQQFKFSLTIGENGRASIAGSSSQDSTPCKSDRSQQPRSDGQDNREDLGLPTFEKRKVLTLLKQMRNDGPPPSPSNAVSRVKKPKNKHKKQSSLPEVELPPILETNPITNAASKTPKVPPIWSQSPQPPSTPKTSFAIRTGFTPNIGIDQVLLDVVTSPKSAGPMENPLNYGYLSNMISLSPKTKTPESSQQGQSQRQSQQAHQESQQRQQEQQEQQQQKDEEQQKQKQQTQQQFVFKFSSADPLLLTDDADGNWSEVIYNHLQNSPRPQICFNTPPSWVNFGSPRAGGFTPQMRRDSTSQTALQNDPSKSMRGLSQVSRRDSVINLSSSPPRRELFPASPLRRPSLPYNTTLTPRVTTNTTTVAGNHNDKLLPEPSTPRGQDVQLPAMIECTPLIQQTMNGSLTTKYLSNVLSTTANGTNDSGINDCGSFAEAAAPVKEPTRHLSSPGGEQEDARAALKKLIAER
ncbi:hypothetical protein ZYGR_0AF03990 [Zygosaccharomyces rouxii]|uniref:Uncharacterized protein n=1 Tax=Zygosaccharomyces rouxii TaxID=4956 RepID=A0A1Q3A8C5_ZYGRO|nr:hypothetical protein ZYGR_0AF03990 [Zygosaccharomyces rouxii]